MSTPTQKIVTVSFTEEEAKAALQLIDAACKSIGLNAAKAAFIIADKINNAFLEGPKGNDGPCAAEGVKLNVVR